MPPPSAVNYSVFVGDLDRSVDESLLFEVFSKVGQVGSVRVCRDGITRRSRGYAYVNFVPIPDTDPARKAVEELSYTKLRTQAIRVMLAQTDKASIKKGVGNVFIKGLPKEVDSRTLHDTFEVFGRITSAKAVCDRDGSSLGFGYVQYEDAECAAKAVDRAHGMLLSGSKLVVAHHVRKDARPAPLVSYTNVYVKNLPETVNTAGALARHFEEFGAITSTSLPEVNGVRKGHGFINFKNPQSAALAIERMNGRIVDGVPIFVAKAQKKSERQKMLRGRFENIQANMQRTNHGKNLYVKNVEASIDDCSFRAMFSHFGEITSSRIMTDATGASRGFGFVCFKTLGEASRALTEMNGRLMGTKHLYVGLAQPKAQRRAQLVREHQMQFPQGPSIPPMNTNSRSDGTRQINPVVASGLGGAMPVYPMPANFMGNPHMMPPHSIRNPSGPPHGMPGIPPTAGFSSQSGLGGMPLPGQQNFVQGFHNNRAHQGSGRQGGRYQGRGGGRSSHGGRGRLANANALNRAGPTMATTPTYPPPQMSLAESLAAVPPEQRKIMLGEKLYALIRMHNVERAAKITGMLLELEQAEVIALVENPGMLQQKVNDALKVLQQASLRGN